MGDVPDNNETLYLGIDGGGTKCRALIVRGDEVLGVGEGGPANPYHGIERALASIDAAADNALRHAGLPREAKSHLVAGLGLAGVNLPSVYQRVAQAELPFRRTYLTTDLHIACIAAHGQDDGAVIVAGTGSCGFSHVRGNSVILGAHGFPLGDVGSGAWMGLEAVKAVLLASDDLGPASVLSELLEEQLQARGLMIVERLNGAKSSDYARLAPLVFHAADQGDAVARDIVTQGAAYLDAVARRLWQTQPPRMAMLGGVARRMVEWMDRDLVARLSQPLQAPEYGAVHFARTSEHQTSGMTP